MWNANKYLLSYINHIILIMALYIYVLFAAKIIHTFEKIITFQAANSRKILSGFIKWKSS